MFFPYACIIDLLTTQKYVISIILTNNPAQPTNPVGRVYGC